MAVGVGRKKVTSGGIEPRALTQTMLIPVSVSGVIEVYGGRRQTPLSALQ